MRPSAVPLALVVIACALLGWAAPATAQGLGTSRVAAVTATIYARCDPGAPARAVLERGAVVTIEAVNEGWVMVSVAGGEQGCMRRNELEPTQSIDCAAEARRAREVAAARGTPPTSSAARPTVAEWVNGQRQRLLPGGHADLRRHPDVGPGRRTGELHDGLRRRGSRRRRRRRLRACVEESGRRRGIHDAIRTTATS